MRITRFVACSSILAMTLPAGSAREKEEAFQDVQRSVQERSGKTVRWEEDQAAHDQALQESRQLLRKPLTVNTAVQIALLNNRSLQAAAAAQSLSQLLRPHLSWNSWLIFNRNRPPGQNWQILDAAIERFPGSAFRDGGHRKAQRQDPHYGSVDWNDRWTSGDDAPGATLVIRFVIRVRRS